MFQYPPTEFDLGNSELAARGQLLAQLAPGLPGIQLFEYQLSVTALETVILTVTAPRVIFE